MRESCDIPGIKVLCTHLCFTHPCHPPPSYVQTNEPGHASRDPVEDCRQNAVMKFKAEIAANLAHGAQKALVSISLKTLAHCRGPMTGWPRHRFRILESTLQYWDLASANRRICPTSFEPRQRVGDGHLKPRLRDLMSLPLRVANERRHLRRERLDGWKNIAASPSLPRAWDCGVATT